MPDTKSIEAIAGLSLKAFLATLIGILLFGVYIGILIYGENSFTVLNHLKDKKRKLVQEERVVKSENQKLQKEYFELKQLLPDEQRKD